MSLGQAKIMRVKARLTFHHGGLAGRGDSLSATDRQREREREREREWQRGQGERKTTRGPWDIPDSRRGAARAGLIKNARTSGPRLKRAHF